MSESVAMTWRQYRLERRMFWRNPSAAFFNFALPLLFLALIRQESRFDPQAVSYAGATGLTQVMPETGQWIASRLGVEPFSTRLLERPAISVRFGIWYMAQSLELFDRDWIPQPREST